MSKELKPCPFCAQPSPREEWFHDGTRFFNYIECFDCGARGAFSLDKEKAKRDWNTRAVPPGYVTKEECKRRCKAAMDEGGTLGARDNGGDDWHDPAYISKDEFDDWYAENYINISR